jgi:hypothetical protein
MKHIKTYNKLFESNSKNLIEDALIDISDDDILVKVTTSDCDDYIDIEISNDKYFDMTKYLHCFEVLNDIVESEGYNCFSVNVYLRKIYGNRGKIGQVWGIAQDKEFKTINNLLNPENVTSKEFKWSNWEVNRIFIELEK